MDTWPTWQANPSFYHSSVLSAAQYLMNHWQIQLYAPCSVTLGITCLDQNSYSSVCNTFPFFTQKTICIVDNCENLLVSFGWALACLPLIVPYPRCRQFIDRWFKLLWDSSWYIQAIYLSDRDFVSRTDLWACQEWCWTSEFGSAWTRSFAVHLSFQYYFSLMNFCSSHPITSCYTCYTAPC